jgi:hypothetical protein
MYPGMTKADPIGAKAAHSRRKGPRIEVLGQLHGQLVPIEIPILLRNLGAGGFAIESSVPFAPRAVHRFRFTTVSGVAVVVTAEVRHTQTIVVPDGSTRHRTGLAFVHEPGGITVRAIEMLLNAATSSLAFE